MLKLNENKTLKELREKGFYVIGASMFYDVNSMVNLVFDINIFNTDYYLRYTGNNYYGLIGPNEYKVEIENALKELKESEFVINE